MKKLLLYLTFWCFLNLDVNAQAVEWVRPIPNKGSVTYVNDSLIYVISYNNCYSPPITINCISNLNIFDSYGGVLKSKNLQAPLKVLNNVWDRIEPQQKFILAENKVLYSNSYFTLDKNLNITTISSSIYSQSLSNELDFFISTQYNNGQSFTFKRINSNGTITGINNIIKEPCFYNYDCSSGYPYFDHQNTFYISRCTYMNLNHDYSMSCNKPLDYIPTNTVGGVLKTYSSQLEATQQSIMSFDNSNNVRLLPLFKPRYKALTSELFLPMNFASNSKGYLFVLDYDGLVAKYSTNPWDSIWTKQLNVSGTLSQISVDNNGNIHVSGLTGQGSSFYTLDSMGNIISTKLTINSLISNFQSDNKKSIYFSSDTGVYNGAQKVLDCFTITSNYIAKLYTGTLPSTPRITRTGLVLKSNFPRGVTWYRNDSLLTSENDTFTLALRDGKYTFKAFCKQDTITFKGISTSNGILKTISIPGASYQWSLNEVPIPNAISNTYSPTSVGNYTVKINFDKNQALYSSGRVSVNNTFQAAYSLNLVQLSVDNDYSQHFPGYFSVFPNPATQSLTIKTAGFTQVPQASILNSLGQEITSLSLVSDHTLLEVSTFPKGIYSIKVGNQVQKLVVE